MSVLTKHNWFVCLDCGSDRLGFVCNGCGNMVCSCKGCPCVVEREREEEERDRFEARREQLHDEVDRGFYD